ncbi:MAG: PEGA domain-containing protein, partial [Polyangiaceae bacterium]
MRLKTKRAVGRAVLSAVLMLGIVAPARAAEPDPKTTEDARAHFQRGVDLYRDADYRSAIIEFRRAYDLVPNWHIQYNIAQSCAEVQDYPCAQRALQAYLAQGAAEVPADRRKTIEDELHRVTGRIAHLSVTVNRADAEVFVDEQSLGKAPLAAPASISEGHRRVSATLPTGQTVSKVIDVAGGDNVSVSLEFIDAPVAAAPKPAPAKAQAPSKAPIIVGLLATGILAAGATTTGILSLGAKSDLNSELGKVPGDGQAIDSARTRARTFAALTDVMGGAAIVAAVITVFF